MLGERIGTQIKERLPLQRNENEKPPTERLADTLLFFVDKADFDKKSRSLKLNPAAEQLRFIAYHAVNSEAVRSIIVASDSEDSLRILEEYFNPLLSKKSFSTKHLKNFDKKADFIHQVTNNSSYGQVALISIGKVGSKVTSELKEKGISTEAFSLAEAVSRRFADSATSTLGDARETAGIVLGGLIIHRNLPEVGLTKLIPTREH